jgi:hypothetical protein
VVNLKPLASGCGGWTRPHHTGQDLRLRLESPEHLRHAGGLASLPYQLRIIAKERWRPPRARLAPCVAAAISSSIVATPTAEALCAAGGRWCPKASAPDLRRGAVHGHVAHFKAGSFLLAIEAGLPIVPLAVIGTRQVMPKGRLRTEPADVRLVVHDPIQPPAIETPTVRDARALAARVHAVVANAVETLQNSSSQPCS